MKKEEIHIGELIQSKLKENSRSKAWLARQVRCDSSSFCKLLKRNHIDTELLMQISQIMNYDFFSHYSTILHNTENGA